MKMTTFISICCLLVMACSPSKKVSVTPKSPTDTPLSNGESKKSDLAVNFINSDDLAGAIRQAKAQNKALFVDFYTTWCAPCKVMEQSVFRDADVAEYLNTNCINLRVNAEAGNGPTLKMENVVSAYPTMLVFNTNGDEIARREGSLNIEDFKKFIKAAVWKVKNP